MELQREWSHAREAGQAVASASSASSSSSSSSGLKQKGASRPRPMAPAPPVPDPGSEEGGKIEMYAVPPRTAQAKDKKPAQRVVLVSGTNRQELGNFSVAQAVCNSGTV